MVVGWPVVPEGSCRSQYERSKLPPGAQDKLLRADVIVHCRARRRVESIDLGLMLKTES